MQQKCKCSSNAAVNLKWTKRKGKGALLRLQEHMRVTHLLP